MSMALAQEEWNLELLTGFLLPPFVPSRPPSYWMVQKREQVFSPLVAVTHTYDLWKILHGFFSTVKYSEVYFTDLLGSFQY
jgi:hypothetical protein